MPFLVAVGSLALLFEPRLTGWSRRRGAEEIKLAGSRNSDLSLRSGYFGAGAGVMTLTLMLVLVDRHLQTANALKNMLIGCASAVSAVLFALFGAVNWTAAIPLAVGMLAGSRAGPLLLRRLPARPLRRLIFLLGMGLAIYLWVHVRSWPRSSSRRKHRFRGELAVVVMYTSSLERRCPRGPLVLCEQLCAGGE